MFSDLHVLVRHETDAEHRHSAFTAHCLDYDLVAQGPSIAEALASLERVMVRQRWLDVQEGKIPFADFEAAPAADNLEYGFWSGGARVFADRSAVMMVNLAPSAREAAAA